MESFFHWLSSSLEQSMGLASPFCPLYLLPSMGIALVWLSRSQQWTLKEASVYLWDNSRQHGRCIGVDGLWALFQLLFLRTPIALLHLALFQWAYGLLVGLASDEAVGWALNHGLEALLATLVTMLAIDVAAYGMHRALHELPGLWWIHELHHQAQYLSPFSTLRQHPLEPFLLNGARGLAAGFALGGLHLLLPNETPIWTIAGMGPGFFLYMFTVNLHHAPLPVRYPRWMRSILVSPHIHHIHHSKAPEHHGKNFGVIFSFWDRWFGTYWDQDVGLGELKFGVEVQAWVQTGP
jgi:sterol desaturase/sphingolipid hydroxylase (fatty acid hydroxylase superfamily)